MFVWYEVSPGLKPKAPQEPAMADSCGAFSYPGNHKIGIPEESTAILGDLHRWGLKNLSTI